MDKITTSFTRLVFAATAFATLSLSSCQKNPEISSLPTDAITDMNSGIGPMQSRGQEFVPNELLVKFKPGLSESARNNALSRIGGNVSEKIHTKAMQSAGDTEGIMLVHSPLAVLEAIGKIKGEEIMYAEPNYIYQHDAVSNDTYYLNGSLWGMYGQFSTPSNQYGSDAAAAWANGHTGSSTVYVGIIDEGAMYNHEDLAGNFGNPLEIASNGIDDDGNGYVDDSYGWDFVHNDNSTFDGNQDDHGTHVAGTIGAKGGNGKGVAGVNWQVRMISGKFLGPNGGTTANAIKAVDYITYLKTHDNLNIVASNNSWGGGGFSQLLKDAIDRSGTNNILFIAAAGNSSLNINISPSYPASYTSSNVIAVAALTSSGGLASYSNFGATSVDIGAPGSGIYSTLPGKKNNSSSYGSYSGTSMATPHVSGAAALYASTHTSASAADIKAAILSNAKATSSLSGKTVTGGRLNVSTF